MPKFISNIRITVVVLLTSICTTTIYGQDSIFVSETFQKKNSLQFELAGTLSLYSVGYERCLWNKNRYKILAQVNCMYFPRILGYSEYFGGSIGMSHLISFDEDHIELGLGQSFLYTNYPVWYRLDEIYHSQYIRFGYRFQKPSGNFVFRASGLVLFQHSEMDLKVIPAPSISFGLVF